MTRIESIHATLLEEQRRTKERLLGTEGIKSRIVAGLSKRHPLSPAPVGKGPRGEDQVGGK